MKPEGLFHRGDATLAHAHPGRAGIGREPVDVVELQPGVGHGLEACVDGQRERVHQQPATECGPADAGQHRAVFEPVLADGPARLGTLGLGDGVTGGQPTGRCEEREPHILVVLEPDGHLLADGDVGRITVHDHGGEPDPGVFFQSHDGDGVGRLERRMPLVVVHRKADDRAPARDHRRFPRPTPAHRADGHGRMDQGVARPAALDAEAAVGPRGPEPLGGGRQLGQRPHGTGCFSPAARSGPRR